MTTHRITREQAEACAEQVRLMFPGYLEKEGFGRPELIERADCWRLKWTDGPFAFGENLARDVAHGSPGVPPAPNWPKGVRVEEVDRQTAALYPAQDSTKAAKDIKAGDWCVLGTLAWRAGEPVINDEGNVLIQWGNGSVSEFLPDERITVDPQGETT